MAGVVSSRNSRQSLVVVFACVAAFVVAGCGGTVVDAQKAEGAIAQNIEVQTDVQVKSVTCPEDVDVNAGDVFDCDITLEDGRTANVELRILNDDADVKIVKLSRT